MPKNKFPANGDFGVSESACFRFDVPRNPDAPVRLVKAALHDGSADTLTLHIERSKLARAIERGTVVVLPKHSLAQKRRAVPPRPYPFEIARALAKARRERFWQRDDVIALKRRGLLMTCDEYARMRAARPSRDEPTGDETNRVD